MYIVDEPNNCFPSLHVSISFLASFVMWRKSRIEGVFFLIWSAAISISTLTTKQHYVADIIGGTLIAIFFYQLMFRRWLFLNKKRSL